jgi:hypothetical protein
MPQPLYPRRKSPQYPLEKRWVDLRAGLYDMEKFKFWTLFPTSIPGVAPLITEGC